MKKCHHCQNFIPDDAVQCNLCQAFLDGKIRSQYRCECRNLLAKLTETTIEIKCRRCKRIHVVNIQKYYDLFNHLLEEREKDGQGQVDLRCECGNLLAKLTEDSFLIKCRGCKRTDNFPISLIPDFHKKTLKKP